VICTAAEKAYADDEEDEELYQQAQTERRKLTSLRRSLQTQGRIALQKVEMELTEQSMTTGSFEERNAEAKRPERIQQMLLDAAAKAASRQNEEDPDEGEDEDDENHADDYADDDLIDARLQADAANAISVGTMALDRDDRQGMPGEEASVAPACRVFLDILTGQEDVVKIATTCRLCEADETVSEEGQAKLYMPGKLNQHLGTNFHSPKSKWLRPFKGGNLLCPYPDCGIRGTGPVLLLHIHSQISQSDDHLLAAAKDGLFARDFDPRTMYDSSTKTRVKDGKAQKVEQKDPEEPVPLSSVIQPRNLTKSGELSENSNVKPDPSAEILRLPTTEPLTETGWWHEHEEGVYGDVADGLAEQRKWIMNKIDANLRDLGQGKASEKGESRTQAHKGKRRVAGLAKLRERLVKLNWQWAEDEENIQQAEEESDGDGDGDGDGAGDGDDDDDGSEFEGFGDD
jgi:hypothetical protein